MLLHGFKPVWFSSTVPPKIHWPLSAAIKCPATDANGAKSHSENSSRQKRSFTAKRPDPMMGHDSMSVVQSPDRNFEIFCIGWCQQRFTAGGRAALPVTARKAFPGSNRD